MEFAHRAFLSVMAAAAYHHPSSSSADPNAAYSAAMAHQQHQQQHQQQQHAAASTGTATSQQPTSLRRAVYVHISDLTSAYNIDHAMLEEELTRVKREAAAAAAGVARKGDDPSRGGGGGASASSASGAVSTIASGAAATTASASLGGVPTELDTNPSQKRLHPPRAGYNLCVYVLLCVMLYSFRASCPAAHSLTLTLSLFVLSHSS